MVTEFALHKVVVQFHPLQPLVLLGLHSIDLKVEESAFFFGFNGRELRLERVTDKL